MPQPSRLHQQGTTYTIPCQITGEDFVFWRTPAGENITLATIDPRRTVVVSGNNYGLKIENITAKDGGQYTCVGSQNSATYTAIVDCKCLVKRKFSLSLSVHLCRFHLTPYLSCSHCERAVVTVLCQILFPPNITFFFYFWELCDIFFSKYLTTSVSTVFIRLQEVLVVKWSKFLVRFSKTDD